MNKFEKQERYAAQKLFNVAKHSCMEYASREDLSAAIVAALCDALELAGGKHFLKPQDENE